MKKKLLIAISVILLLTLAIAAKVFLIGDPVDGTSMVCDVRESENQVDILVTTPASAIGFTNVRFRQVDTTLYLSFREVLVSPLFPSGQKSIYIEKCDLTQIVLGGEVIWSLAE